MESITKWYIVSVFRLICCACSCMGSTRIAYVRTVCCLVWLYQLFHMNSALHCQTTGHWRYCKVLWTGFSILFQLTLNSLRLQIL